MRCLLAAFDQAHLSPDGTYWSWRHSSLELAMLDRFYYEYAAKHLPEENTLILPDCLHGGCASLGDDWICWYRFIDGGRDKAGRPGRMVLVAGFAPRPDHAGKDLSGVLESSLFQELARCAPATCPLPAPKDLILEWDPPLLNVDVAAASNRLLRERSISSESCRSLRELAALCDAIPLSQAFDCVFYGRKESVSFTVLLGDDLTEGSGRSIATPLDEATNNSSDRKPSPSSSHVRRWPNHFALAPYWKVRQLTCQPATLISGVVLGALLGIPIGWLLCEFFTHRQVLPRHHESSAAEYRSQPIPSRTDDHPIVDKAVNESTDP
jgi:hypothetical protein